jgi:hypothetical protein
MKSAEALEILLAAEVFELSGTDQAPSVNCEVRRVLKVISEKQDE